MTVFWNAWYGFLNIDGGSNFSTISVLLILVWRFCVYGVCHYRRGLFGFFNYFVDDVTLGLFQSHWFILDDVVADRLLLYFKMIKVLSNRFLKSFAAGRNTLLLLFFALDIEKFEASIHLVWRYSPLTRRFTNNLFSAGSCRISLELFCRDPIKHFLRWWWH